MSNPLLLTKLYRPRARTDWIARPELVERLTNAVQHRLTILSAPAGFGKSTLLAAWLEQATLPVAWIALDEADNDPVRFWAYVLAAIQTVAPAVGHETQAMLAAPQSPTVEALLTPLINDLAQLDQALIVALDDYHAIQSTAIHDGMSFLIQQLPPAVHLVLAGRANPPLPLARLRARGELAEIRAADLRFSRLEISTLLTQSIGHALPDADIAALETRTEGWVAGLQLAALSLRGRTDVGAFINEFTGSHRYVIDYLFEEVLQRLPPATERFLTQTAILTRLCCELCAFVTGEQGAQAILEQLERSNLFLTALDVERQWYRYHHLFADVLRHRLQQQQPALVSVLYERASRWFAANRWPSDAIQHAMAGGHHALAAELIEGEAEAMLKRGEYRTLQQWLTQLPTAAVWLRPRLCLFAASIAVTTHELAAAEEWLIAAEAALSALPSDQQNVVVAESAAISAGIALNRGDFPRTLAAAERALALLPANQQRLRAELYLHVGLARSWSLDPDGAVQAYQEAGRLALLAGDMHTALLALFNQGSQHFMRANLQDAAATYRHALQVAGEAGASRIPITSALHRGLAELYYEWNDLTTAASHLQEAVERGGRGGSPRIMVLNDLAQARLQFAHGEHDAALTTVAHALQLAVSHKLPPRYASPPAGLQARLWLAQGNLALANQWALQTTLRLDGELDHLYEVEYLALARIFIACGDAELAQKLVARLRSDAEAVSRVNSVIEILAVEALAWQAQADLHAACTALTQALLLGAPGGYMRTFLDEGNAIQRLLRTIRPQISVLAAQTYADKLLAAFAVVAPNAASQNEPAQPAATPKHGPSPFHADALIEQLTARELEILRVVATGLSDRQVAEQLIIAIGTVKRHLNSIYGKLGVRSRTHALARARDLGLL